MNDLHISLDNFLSFQRMYNNTVFTQSFKNDLTKLNLVTHTVGGVQLVTSLDLNDANHIDIWDFIKTKVNKPITPRDHRVVSHDFANNTTWVSTEDSTFVCTPPQDTKLVITHIQVRFPKTAKLVETNKLIFTVNLFSDSLGELVPAINLEYGSIKDLILKTNSPVSVLSDVIETVSTQKIIELTFNYADHNTLLGSPINLRYSKGENITIKLNDNTPVLDSTDTAYTGDPIWCVINGKYVPEF